MEKWNNQPLSKARRGDAEAQTRFETTSKQSNDLSVLRVNTLGSGEDRLKLKELMDLCTKLSDRVLNLETIKTAQAKEIASFKKRVKNLDRKRKSKTLGMNLFKIDMDEMFKDVEGDAKQVISAAADEVPTNDAGNTAGTEVNTTSAPVTTAGVSVSTAEPITPPTTTTTVFKDEDLIIAQTLMKIRSEKSKTKEMVRWLNKKNALKKKDQIKFDEKIAQRLQVQMQAEVEEEERLAREREEDANIAEWDNVQAMMDADYELAARLQA
ncbi:hypothetical protein Tco_1333235 [Tanacetum coccineum]